MDKKTIAAMIDHTLLKPEVTPAQIEKLCAEAAEYHFASVCVNPVYIPLAARLLKGTGVKVCCVVGFPLGAIAPEQKAAEAASCAAMGAEELDMVIHVGAAKAGDWALVQRDIEGVVKAAAGHTVKVKIHINIRFRFGIEVNNGLVSNIRIGCPIARLNGQNIRLVMLGFTVRTVVFHLA